jgi:hypothetical protein
VKAIIIASDRSDKLFEQSKEGNHKMQIKRNGEQPSQKGPDDWFTGRVRIDPLHTAPAPARVGAALVTFEPGARIRSAKPSSLSLAQVGFSAKAGKSKR